MTDRHFVYWHDHHTDTIHWRVGDFTGSDPLDERLLDEAADEICERLKVTSRERLDGPPKTPEPQRRVRIVHDDYVPDPRKDMDWVGTMVCWHKHYILGDERPTESPAEWLEGLAQEQDRELYQTALNGVADYYEYDDLDPAEKLRFDAYWHRVGQVLKEKVIILGLYLHDHGMIGMSVSKDIFVWDTEDLDERVDVNPDVGFIYVTRERAAAEYGIKEWTPEAEQKVIKCLTNEVEVYDQYLRGEVYGFICEELAPGDCPNCDWQEVDSCWGFYGSDPDENGMREYWPEEFQNAPIINDWEV